MNFNHNERDFSRIKFKKKPKKKKIEIIFKIITCNPLARITSTSRQPFWWHIDNWISPNEEAPNTCRPTNCPGPRPSIKSEYCPTSAPLSDGDHLYTHCWCFRFKKANKKMRFAKNKNKTNRLVTILTNKKIGSIKKS